MDFSLPGYGENEYIRHAWLAKNVLLCSVETDSETFEVDWQTLFSIIFFFLSNLFIEKWEEEKILVAIPVEIKRYVGLFWDRFSSCFSA